MACESPECLLLGAQHAPDHAARHRIRRDILRHTSCLADLVRGQVVVPIRSHRCGMCVFHTLLSGKTESLLTSIGLSHRSTQFTQDIHREQSQLTTRPFKQGLVFSMIIVRIGLGLTAVDGHQKSFSSISTRLRTRPASDTPTTSWTSPNHHEHGIPMQPITDPKRLNSSAQDEIHVDDFPLAAYKTRRGEGEGEGEWPHLRPLR